jgi:alpha-1,2-mannosyltransferase
MTLPAWLLVPGAAVFVVSLVVFLLLNNSLGFGGYDLTVYLAGGEAFRHGQPVYDATVQSAVGIGYFTYPPVTMLLFGPMSLLSHNAALTLMVIVGLLALVGVIAIAGRMVGVVPDRGFIGGVLGLAGLVLWLQPVYDSIGQGQINILLVLLILLDLWLAESRPAVDGVAGAESGRGRRWPTGVLIGLATAMKITPGIFIVYLLLTRRFRAAAVAVGTWAGLTALGFAVAGSDSVDFWFKGVFSDSNRVTLPLTAGSTFNQSLHGVLVRVLGSGAGNGVWYPLALVVAAAGLAIAVAAYRREGALAGAVCCAITGLLVSPVSWHEHWVWMVPGLVVLADVARRLRAPVLVRIAVPVVVAMPFLMWPLSISPGKLGPESVLSPARHMWEDKGNHGLVPLVLGAAYVLTGLVLLAVAAWALRRSAPSQSPATARRLEQAAA